MLITSKGRYVLGILTISLVFVVQSLVKKAMVKEDTTSLFDGCRYVFLDVGANIGVHNRFLFEPSRYPALGDQEVANMFSEVFPRNRTRGDTCAFAFEPNPERFHRLDLLESAYRMKGWRLVVMKVAVSFEDGFMDFVDSGGLGGASALADIASNLEYPNQPKVTRTKVIDFGAWVNKYVHKRNVPPPLEPEDPPPAVVMKMDIEGYEFRVLPKMLLVGALCHINRMFIEWHDAWGTRYCEPYCNLKPSLRGILNVSTSFGCMSPYSFIEPSSENNADEVYVWDPVPLPYPVCACNAESDECQNVKYSIETPIPGERNGVPPSYMAKIAKAACYKSADQCAKAVCI